MFTQSVFFLGSAPSLVVKGEDSINKVVSS